MVYDFQFMLITAGAVGVASAVVGLFVLLRREALVALAIPQVVAIGAAMGMRLGWENKLPPALGVAMIALVYFALSKRSEHRQLDCPIILCGRPVPVVSDHRQPWAGRRRPSALVHRR